MYSVHQKHLTVFEILKPGWLLLGISLLTVTMKKDALSLVKMERWSVHHYHHTAAVDFFFYQNSLLQLHSVVSNSRFNDVMLLAVILNCGYRNGIRKYQ